MIRQLCVALGLALTLGSFSSAAAPPSLAGQRLAGRSLRAWLDDLHDSDLLIREEAVEVLAQAGPAARIAVPQLRRLLTHENRPLRSRAALALWKIAGETAPAVETLSSSLRDAG